MTKLLKSKSGDVDFKRFAEHYLKMLQSKGLLRTANLLITNINDLIPKAHRQGLLMVFMARGIVDQRINKSDLEALVCKILDGFNNFDIYFPRKREEINFLEYVLSLSAKLNWITLTKKLVFLGANLSSFTEIDEFKKLISTSEDDAIAYINGLCPLYALLKKNNVQETEFPIFYNSVACVRAAARGLGFEEVKAALNEQPVLTSEGARL